MIRSVRPTIIVQCQNARERLFATQVEVKQNAPETSNRQLEPDWNNAIPYEKIPGPSRYSFIKDTITGRKTLLDIMGYYRELYGEMFKIPGMFGRKDMIMTNNPNDFEKVFRTEGVWPVRQGLDTITYYRKKVRPDVYYNGGLLTTQGKDWGDFRTAVNPVMMQPKTVKLYVPKINEVSMDFIKRIREIRDPESLEMPENFEEELNKCMLESIGVIALDTRLGLIGDLDQSSKGRKFIDALKVSFELMIQLDFQPSPWKIIKTPKFHKLMAAFDVITNTCHGYIQEAKIRLEAADRKKENQEESVLEKLLKIDAKVAQVMAADLIGAGVDTTSSAITGIMYQLAKFPIKQEVLRQEIRKILPNKDSVLTPEKMSIMPYLRACIKEGLRMKPVIFGNLRATGQDIVLNGYQIPKGVDVSLASGFILAENKYFPKANEFIPERWLRDQAAAPGCPAAKTSTNPFTFLPFGFGPRMCIGKRFAELEIEVFITNMVRNFYIEWNRPDLKFKSVMINLPDGKLQFKLTDVVD